VTRVFEATKLGDAACIRVQLFETRTFALSDR
jgi:hypothetical protein